MSRLYDCDCVYGIDIGINILIIMMIIKNNNDKDEDSLNLSKQGYNVNRDVLLPLLMSKLGSDCLVYMVSFFFDLHMKQSSASNLRSCHAFHELKQRLIRYIWHADQNLGKLSIVSL